MLEWIPIPFSGDLPDPGIEPWSSASQAGSLPFELQGSANLFNMEIHQMITGKNLLLPSVVII